VAEWFKAAVLKAAVYVPSLNLAQPFSTLHDPAFQAVATLAATSKEGGTPRSASLGLAW